MSIYPGADLPGRACCFLSGNPWGDFISASAVTMNPSTQAGNNGSFPAACSPHRSLRACSLTFILIFLCLPTVSTSAQALIVFPEGYRSTLLSGSHASALAGLPSLVCPLSAIATLSLSKGKSDREWFPFFIAKLKPPWFCGLLSLRSWHLFMLVFLQYQNICSSRSTQSLNVSTCVPFSWNALKTTLPLFMCCTRTYDWKFSLTITSFVTISWMAPNLTHSSHSLICLMAISP